MYDDNQINDMFGKYIKDNEYFKTYVSIYKYFKENEMDGNKFHYHHFYPSFLRKIENDEFLKNRYHAIEKLDNDYDPDDNVVKLPIKWHVIAHYCLGLALRTTDAENSFYVLIGDYSKSIESYTFDDVDNLARLIEENAMSNSLNQYMTQRDKKEMYKSKQKEYQNKWNEEHKDELFQRKQEYKNRQKEYQKKWKDEHKDELLQKKQEYKERMKQYLKNKKNGGD